MSPEPCQSVNDHRKSTTSDPQTRAISIASGMPTITARTSLSRPVSRCHRWRPMNGSRLSGNRSNRPRLGGDSAATPDNPDSPGWTGVAEDADLSALDIGVELRGMRRDRRYLVYDPRESWNFWIFARKAVRS